MTTKATLFLIGACIGAATPLIIRAARPLAAYALAGGMLAYEVACDAIEHSQETYKKAAKRMRENSKKQSET